MKKVLSLLMTLVIILVLVFAVTTVAYADGGGAAATQPDLVNGLIEKAADIVQTLILAAIGILGAWVSSKLALSTELKNVGAAWDDLVKAANITVGELKQTTVDAMKAAHEDGTLTDDEVSDLRKKLIAKTMEKMSKPAYDILIAAGVDVQALILGAGDAFLQEIKRTSFPADAIMQGIPIVVDD